MHWTLSSSSGKCLASALVIVMSSILTTPPIRGIGYYMSKRTEILAYLAGIVDGEGYIGIKKSKPYNKLTGRVNPGYDERIQIRMVERGALRLLERTLGGWCYYEKAATKNRRPLFCYQASQLKAARICEILLPFLRIKRKQALAVLRLTENKASAKRIKTKVVSRSRWGTPMTGQRSMHSVRTISLRESLWLLCKRLNKTGI